VTPAAKERSAVRNSVGVSAIRPATTLPCASEA
jgi:hypothetical protein